MLRVHGADLRVARAHEREDAGCFVQELGKVLARERAAVRPHAFLSERLDDGRAAACAADRVVLDLEVGDGVVGELGLAAESVGGLLGHALDELRHLVVQLHVVGAYRAGEICAAGDDVARGAAVELADGYHGGLVGVGRARDDRLQGAHDLRAGHDGIVPALGHGAVAARAAHVDAEPIGVGHAVARLAADGPGVDLAPDMLGEHAVHALAHALADHHLGAAAVLLGGLEHDAHLAVDPVGHAGEDAQTTEHHGDVAVVPAGVHAALVHARPGLAGLLGHGEGIDVGAQQDAPARGAVCAVSVGGGPGEGRHKAGLERALKGDAHGGQLARDILGGLELGEAELGVPMEVPALLHDVGLRLLGEALDLRGRIGLGGLHSIHLMAPSFWFGRRWLTSIVVLVWPGRRSGFCNRAQRTCAARLGRLVDVMVRAAAASCKVAGAVLRGTLRYRTRRAWREV